MSKIVTLESDQKIKVKNDNSGLDSAKSGQLNLGSWHLEAVSEFVDIWKIWQKKCSLMRHTQRKLALSSLKEIRLKSLTLSQKTDVNLQVIFT